MSRLRGEIKVESSSIMLLINSCEVSNIRPKLLLFIVILPKKKKKKRFTTIKMNKSINKRLNKRSQSLTVPRGRGVTE